MRYIEAETEWGVSPEDSFCIVLNELHAWQRYDRYPASIPSKFESPLGFHISVFEPTTSLYGLYIEEKMYDSDIYLPLQSDEYCRFVDEVIIPNRGVQGDYVSYDAQSIEFVEDNGFVVDTLNKKYKVGLSARALIELRSDWVDR